MEHKPRNSGRRHQILAMLDGRHPSQNGFPEWSSAAVASVCGIAWATAHHALTRLKKYGLVESERVGGTVTFSRPLADGNAVAGSAPSQTLAWKITPKGRGRLKYFGGHQKWCPLCKDAP